MSVFVLKPARPGLIVRDPRTGTVLPATGARVLLDSYWRRRLAAGDVCKTTRRQPAKQKTQEQTDGDQL